MIILKKKFDICIFDTICCNKLLFLLQFAYLFSKISLIYRIINLNNNNVNKNLQIFQFFWIDYYKYDDH